MAAPANHLGPKVLPPNDGTETNRLKHIAFTAFNSIVAADPNIVVRHRACQYEHPVISIVESPALPGQTAEGEWLYKVNKIIEWRRQADYERELRQQQKARKIAAAAAALQKERDRARDGSGDHGDQRRKPPAPDPTDTSLPDEDFSDDKTVRY